MTEVLSIRLVSVCEREMLPSPQKDQQTFGLCAAFCGERLRRAAATVYCACVPVRNRKEPMEKKKSILVVDDEPRILRFVCTTLKLAGYNAMSCTDGEQALTIAEREKPEAMILDIVMKPLSGFLPGKNENDETPESL